MRTISIIAGLLAGMLITLVWCFILIVLLIWLVTNSVNLFNLFTVSALSFILIAISVLIFYIGCTVRRGIYRG